MGQGTATLTRAYQRQTSVPAGVCKVSRERTLPGIALQTLAHEEALTAQAGGAGSTAEQIRLLLIPAHGPGRWEV